LSYADFITLLFAFLLLSILWSLKNAGDAASGLKEKRFMAFRAVPKSI